MLFNSYVFILIFLPLTLFGYYLLHFLHKETLAYLELAGMSFWFYGYFNPGYLLIIGSSILVNYGVSILLRRRDGQPLKSHEIYCFLPEDIKEAGGFLTP